MKNQQLKKFAFKYGRSSIQRIAAAMATALFLSSGSVYAVPTDVNIVGGGSANKAKVDGSGKLMVASTLKVPSTVWTTPNNPTLDSAHSRVVLWQGLGLNKVSISSIIAAATAPTAGSVPVYISVYVSDTASGDCTTLTGGNFGAAERFRIQVPVGDTVQLTWPSPLVLSHWGSPTNLVCVDAGFGSGAPSSSSVYLFASGFTN